MGLDGLLNIIDKKIKDLRKKDEESLKEIQKIQQIHDAILELKKDVTSLYSLKDDELDFVVKTLELDEEQVEKLNRNKTIYQAFSMFGRSAVPQMDSLEKDNVILQKIIDDKANSLAQEIEKNKQSESSSLKYEKLKEDFLNENKPISFAWLINDLLAEHKLSFEEKLSIKLSINERNKKIYEERLKQIQNKKEEEIIEEETIIDVEEVVELSESDKLNNKIKEKFSDKEIANLHAISLSMDICTSKEELNELLESWKYSFPNHDWDEVIEGLIDLKNVEKLITLEIIGDDIDSLGEELNGTDSQISLLNDYYEDMFLENVERNEETPNQSLSKLDSALQRYNPDVLSTPKVVLYLHDALDKDIRTITDKETLEDVFVLIEQLKYDEVESICKFRNAKTLKDLYEIKPSSLGRQARVVYSMLGDNVYGIISISGKKGDYPKSWRSMLEQRRKNTDIDGLRESINDKDVLNGYIERTEVISSKLYEMVSGSKASKKSNDAKKI